MEIGNMEEIWKDIKGFEGLFQVSSFGRVKTLKRVVRYTQRNQYGEFETSKTIQEKIQKPRKTKSGYLRVQLFDKEFYVHRLVASAFIRPLKPKEEINHIDGNKANNHVDNLEIVSRVQNQNHAYHSGLNELIPPAISVEVNGKVYSSLGEASRSSGIPKGVLYQRLSHQECGIQQNPYKYHFTIKRV